jgi:HSP20 family molecular chaperone IbpA
MRSLFDDFYPFNAWLEGRTDSNNFVRSNIDCDIQQNKDGDLLVQLALPGVSKDLVNAWSQRGELVVEVKAAEEKPDEDTRYLHKGIKSGSRSFRMGIGEEHQIEGADFKDGILEIYLKHVVPEAKKRQEIPISHQADES